MSRTPSLAVASRRARILAAVRAAKKSIKEIAFDEDIAPAIVRQTTSAAGYRMMLVDEKERATVMAGRAPRGAASSTRV